MAADIELPKRVFAHGWWTVEGQKMSKSLGNVVAPAEVCDKYGVDQFRFFLFREVPFGLDGDFSKDAIVHRINGDLANDFGNLVSRSVTMINRFVKGILEKPDSQAGTDDTFRNSVEGLVDQYEKDMNDFAFYKALQDVFEITGLLNRYIDSEAPWKLAKEDEKRLKTVLFNIWNGVRIATILLYPFMPEKTAIIWNALGKRDAIVSATFQNEKVFYHSEELAAIEKIPPIFPRLEA
jgi:methionyl-tRNA synthetase